MPKLIVHLHLKCDPEEYLAYARDGVSGTRNFEGCISFTTHQDLDDPSHFVSVQEWRSREDQAKYTEWQRAKGNVAKTHSLLAEPPRLVWLEEVDL
jgi:quinol monooxygenase YgiN